MVPRTEERRLVTVLFADLSGFTPLSIKLDPEEVRDVVDICFEHLNTAIIEHGGTIHKYEGDLVITLFGFPIAHEDDPERAIKASLKLMDLLPEINKILSSKLRMKSDLGLHIGINSGTVFVGEVGSLAKKEHTVIGEVVNLASRLKDTAKRGEILVSESVFRASRHLFEYKAYPPVSVKGIREPVKVFMPLRVKEKPEPKRGIKGLYSPLIGRDNELNLLKQAVKKLPSGKGSAVFILGHAGLGKSRLLEELKKSIADQKLKIMVLEGQCLSHGETVLYWPFLQIIENFFGITDQDSKKIVQEKLLTETKDIFPDIWGGIVPYIGYLFSIRFADKLDEKVKHLDAQALKLQIFVSVRKLLAALSLSQPLLLVIEDYHWIDMASLELLEFIFDAPEAFPILFLGLSRIEKDKECHKTKERLKKKLDDNFQEMVLEPLDVNASTQLVYNLLEIPGIPEELKDKILAKAEGNPFYLEEILRSLIDTGVLVLESGIWHLVADVSALEIPDTIQAVIASRLDRLVRDVRDVLQMASVMGRNFYGRILEYLCGLDSLMLTLHLATLEDFEYISELRKQPESEYTFRHPLLQEVTYNGLLKKRRRELHGKTGEAIEEIYKDRLDDFTELLAHQYANSNNHKKALEWLKKAGQKAKNRYANDEAIRYFQRLVSIIKEGKGREAELCVAYEALGDIYNLKGNYEPAIKFYEEMYRNAGEDKLIISKSRRKVARIYQTLGRYDDALKILERTEKMLTKGLEEMLEKSEIAILRCWIYGLKGEMDKAIKQGEMGLKVVDGLSRSKRIEEKKVHKIKAAGFNNLGTLFLDKGEYDRAIDFLQKTLKISEEIDDKHGICKASNNLGLVYEDKGDYDKAIELYQKCLRISEEIGYKQGIGRASNNLGNVYKDKGEYDKAIELLQKHLKISEEISDKQGIGIASNNLGLVYEDKGEHDKAIELYQKCLKISEEIGYRQGIGRASCNLGGLFLETKELNKAHEYLSESVEICKEVGDKSTLIDVYENLAELKNARTHLRDHLNKDALAYVDRALNLVEELGLKSSKAPCYLIYGEIYASAGDFKTAEGNFRKAMKIFEELNQKKMLADVYLTYAKVLKKGVTKGVYSKDQAIEYFNKAWQIYKELKLTHKIKECK